MVTYLSVCPLPLAEDHILEIAGLLLELPDMSDDDADELALLQRPATDDDVALPTDDVDPELLYALLVDAPQQLDELEQAVSQWVAGACSEANMKEALRTAHTLKGSGSIIGLQGIARLAHRLEDILLYAADQLQSSEMMYECPPEALGRDVMQAVHCLQQMVNHLQGNEEAPNNAKLVLQKLLDWVKLIRNGEVGHVEPSSEVYVEPSSTFSDQENATIPSPFKNPLCYALALTSLAVCCGVLASLLCMRSDYQNCYLTQRAGS
jgi:chemosensory pili system protein ChpA (sensor histidine kinase/response regulator)